MGGGKLIFASKMGFSSPKKPYKKAQTWSNRTMEKYLQDFIALCDDLAWGRVADEEALYQLTQRTDVPKEVNALAEAFGLMLVKISAREYHRDQLIETLQEQNIVLEEARKMLLKKNIALEAGIESTYSKNAIVGQDEALRKQVDLALTIARRPINTMIMGPTGSGKEVFAKTIHYNSARRDAPFIAVNCTAIPETLFESEMFGIEKNVATGVSARKGIFEEAHEGTLFLDEIADMSLANQAKLLRVLEERKITRVGSVKEVPVNFLLISASHKNFPELIKQGKFREDLFYRINVVEIDLPPLNERGQDILILANYFLARHEKNMLRSGMRLSNLVKQALLHYTWPGNVRELNNEMERAAALSLGDIVEFSDLSQKIQQNVADKIDIESLASQEKEMSDSQGGTADGTAKSTEASSEAFSENGVGLSSLPVNLQDAEKMIIKHVLDSCENKSKAAEILGITREGLRKKLLRLNITD